MTPDGAGSEVPGSDSAADLLSAAHWTVRSTPAGDDDGPSSEPVPAQVPGTVAGALRAAGESLDGMDERDWWFETEVPVPPGVDAVTLEFDGVATLFDVLIDGALCASGSSMFVPLRAPSPVTAGATMRVALCCRSVTHALGTRRPRGRWRSSMVSAQGLRWIRTSMLGRAPVFSGAPEPIGPWRAVRCLPVAEAPAVTVRGVLRGDAGVVTVAGTARPGAVARVEVSGSTATLVADEAGILAGEVEVGAAARWWPHTHGEPALHDVTVEIDGTRAQSRVGFRTAELVAEPSGAMSVLINGERVYCRGGCWVPLDPFTLQNDPRLLDEALTSLVAAGLNMVRITGTMVYESAEFHARCDELGIMVWQDVMLATVDPPEDEAFEAAMLAEVRALAVGPSTVVLSGGSETYQQPAMLGLAPGDSRIALLDSVLPALVADEMPGVAYVPSTPSGGDLPIHVGSGVAHYFGVGGYLRPLSDVHGAGVGFAAECLAFSVPPERRVVDAEFGSAAPAGHDPRWKAAVPRDRGSSWDFEDVRDHYVRTVFGVQPADVRRDDPERYLDYGRAVICEAVTEAYTYWRGRDSGCGGALVLTLRDLEPGAGWGFADSAGGRKAPWFALARASAPTTVLVRDVGMDGLRIEVAHDGPTALQAELTVRTYLRTGAVSVEGSQPITVSPRSSEVTTADAVLGRFTDLTHAYRFGARPFDAVSVALTGPDGEVIAESVTLIGGPDRPLQNTVGLDAVATQGADGAWILTVSAAAAAQYVCVDVDGFAPSDSWFHLAPGTSRALTLQSTTQRSTTPRGHVRALNSIARATVTIGGS